MTSFLINFNGYAGDARIEGDCEVIRMTYRMFAPALLVVGFVALVWAGEQPKAPAPPKGDAKAGKAVYDKNCTVCHGKDGSGNKALSIPAFSDPRVIKDRATAEKWVKAIVEGVKGKTVTMKGYKGKLKPVEIDNVAAYSWQFRTPKEEKHPH
jgi:mono/diheme cytochrome c family protein